MNLLQLRPGITIVPGGGAWTQTTNGMRPEHNVYILDGITAMEPLGGQSTINSVSFRPRRGYSVAHRHHPGVQHPAEPQGGIRLEARIDHQHRTQVGHKWLPRIGGTAYGRTDATDARNGFLTGDQKQQVTLKNYGGSIGGPIRKDKLFFFRRLRGARL